ncbi:MAG: response regulator transcription factor [Pseudomonadota bacterium]
MRTALIADDHPIFRAGLRQIVEEAGYQVVAEAGDGKTCISSCEITDPDVVVLDLAMPGMDGYAVLEQLRKSHRDTTIVVVSMHSSKAYANRAKELGARAFVAKEDAAAEIQHALATPAGVFYISASVGGERTPTPDLTSRESAIDKLDCLTKTERRIFELVGDSMTSRSIAEHLGLSHRTVQTHRTNISRKLEVSGPNRLLEMAILHRKKI